MPLTGATWTGADETEETEIDDETAMFPGVK